MVRIILRLAAGAVAGLSVRSCSAFDFTPPPPPTNVDTSNFEKMYTPPHPTNPDNSIVFFDLLADDKPLGRVEFEIFDDMVPELSTNFKCLCTGLYMGHPIRSKSQLRNRTPGRERLLTYKNTLLHKVVPGFIVQGGDNTLFNGRGGESVGGRNLHDESFKGKAGQVLTGSLAMANHAKHSNHSQFFIAYRPCPWLKKRNVVIGQVIKGWDVLRKVELCGTPSGVPRYELSIGECGILKQKSGALKDPLDPAAVPRVDGALVVKRGAPRLAQHEQEMDPESIDSWLLSSHEISNPTFYDMRSGDGTGKHKPTDLFTEVTATGC